MEYVSLLKKNFPQDNCQFLQADVKELSPILHDLQLHQIDLIVSGLPYMPFLQHPYLQEIIKTHIDKGAQFRAISYSPRAFRRIYSLLDPEIKAFTFWNIPPLFIMGTN